MILLLVFLGDDFYQDIKFHYHNKIQEVDEIHQDDFHSSDDCHQYDEFSQSS